MLHRAIEEVEQELEHRKTAYLMKWGWKHTCNTPGSYWLWQRDFFQEDADRHARWKTQGPGPLGWPSEPRPYGIITASLDLAVSMTVRALDEQSENEDDES